MDDKEKIYALYEKYVEKYNIYYGEKLKVLFEKRDFEAVFNLFKTKFTEKKVDISLDNGIIFMEMLIATERYDKALKLLLELKGWHPKAEELKEIRKKIPVKLAVDVEAKSLVAPESEKESKDSNRINILVIIIATILISIGCYVFLMKRRKSLL